METASGPVLIHPSDCLGAAWFPALESEPEALAILAAQYLPENKAGLELQQLLQLVALFRDKKGRYKGPYSANRRARNLRPNAKITIGLVESVHHGWRLGGLVALKVYASNEPRGAAGGHDRARHRFREIAAVEFTPTPRDRLFLCSDYLVQQGRQPDLEYHAYRVAATSQFGTYRFDLARHEPPGVDDIDFFCAVATRIGPPR